MYLLEENEPKLRRTKHVYEVGAIISTKYIRRNRLEIDRQQLIQFPIRQIDRTAQQVKDVDNSSQSAEIRKLMLCWKSDMKVSN
jgi:hypothetical protein